MGEKWEFKSAKGNSVKVEYAPGSSVRISDKKAFEKYLKKIVDFIQVDDKKTEAKPDKPKTIEAVAGVEEKEVKKNDELF